MAFVVCDPCRDCKYTDCVVVCRVLGASFAGTPVSDFYAAYNGWGCGKQRCLVHLLRELAKPREGSPGQSVRASIQPLIDLSRDAIQVGKGRGRPSAAAFAQARQAIVDRFDELLLTTRTGQPECLRIWRRLARHCDELFAFLRDPRVPADNNGSERDIRSLAAARNDGGTHQAGWSAAAFARRKSAIVAGMKNGVRFISYGIEVVRAKVRGARLPLPLAAAPNTSQSRHRIAGWPRYPVYLAAARTRPCSPSALRKQLNSYRK